jgi:hypothetical protein
MRSFDLATAGNPARSRARGPVIDLTEHEPGTPSMPARLRYKQVEDWARRALAGERKDQAAVRAWMLDVFDELDPGTQIEALLAWNLILTQTLARCCLTDALNNAGRPEAGVESAAGAAMVVRAADSALGSLREWQDEAPSRRPAPELFDLEDLL